jgi:Domain of unknown function (DUF932)
MTSTEIVHFDGETSTPAPGAFSPITTPFRLLADERDNWRVVRTRVVGQGISWDQARDMVAASQEADGERSDRGLGALDRLVVDYDTRGVLHVTEARTERGSLVPGFVPVPLRVAAFRQLSGRIGAPSAYLAKLPAGLARACITHGISATEGSKTGLLRMAGGQARALLTGRYAVLDHGAFLDAAETAIEGAGISLSDVRVSALATGPRLVVRVTLASKTVALAKGDIVEAGIDLVNGELGNAAGSVTPSVYRLVCTNGLRRNEKGAKRTVRHIGDPARAVETLRGAIPAAIDDAMGTARLFHAASSRVVENEVALWDGGLRLFGLSAQEERTVRDVTQAELLSEGIATNFLSVANVVNGITAHARSLSTERRLEVESAAGDYLAAARKR